MSTNNSEVNYPDILGFITDDKRINIGVVQAAMAIRPRVPRAGRPFEVIMLVQNAADVAVDLTVNLTVPERDAQKNKGRFLVGNSRLVIGLEPAEVGIIKLPVSTMPDTAVSEDYSVTMDLDAKPLEKPTRIRATQGGGLFNLKNATSDQAEIISSLKKLEFSINKKGGLFRGGNSLEVKFGLMPGKVGKIAKLEAGWESVWKLEDNKDDTVFLDRYGELIRVHTIPALKRNALYKALGQRTKKLFDASGYPLTDIELSLVTRVLVLILEYANTKELMHGGLAAGIYDVKSALSEKERAIRVEPPVLPHWLKAFLRVVAKDERFARVPVKAIPHFIYDDLLLDAITYSFKAVEISTGEDLGTPEEMDEYAKTVISNLKRKGKMDFTHAYMPLIMGGVLLFDRVTIGDEQLKDVLKEIRTMLSERMDEHDDDNDAIFDMSAIVIDHTLKKFGMFDQ